MKGSCHCQRIVFEVEQAPTEVMSCNCSHCQRKGYLLWFIPRDAFGLKTSVSEMSVYTFNKHAIKHYFCPVCGCAPFGEGTGPDGSAMAAVNARCLEDIDLSTLTIKQVDGKSF